MNQYQYKVTKFCLKAGCQATSLASAFGANLSDILKVQSTDTYDQYINSDKNPLEDLFGGMTGRNPFGL